ncbi:Pimeloyl-ACP methyl ester carboxylesterase [Arenibacter nanhaiticus]|uniref:Pimeloyl-ACP methyl ester carboxylesterase n=1 Tax=Arenibacter nanhaiticus TaxID=558155 RepID=A0A1M6EZI3_9FLAO|nr:alpha/beta hydrolase [Arenibacter nanhaiticus]SHI90894.1 Pimeloyl-ACP methyl ester carboxylesterase [Arenibacter nanhaiticus]
MKRYINKLLPLAYGGYFNVLAQFSEKTAAQKAFDLFSTPRKGRVLPSQADFLNRALSDKIYVNKLGVQTYHWQGSKETVLLLHGWESNAFRWRLLIEKLQEKDYNIIAFDAPGHGYSEGNKMNVLTYSKSAQQLIDLFNPSYMIGHSMGGLTTIYNQYLHPHSSIEKIVSLGAPAELSELMEHYQNLLRFNDKVLTGLDNYFFDNFNIRIHDFSTSKYAATFTKPGLIIHDEHDTIAPFSASERLHKSWKNSTLIKTTGLGHSLHQEHVNQQILEFLKV